MCRLPARVCTDVHVQKTYRSFPCLRILLLAFSSREIILNVYIDSTLRIIYSNYSITSSMENEVFNN